MFTHLRETGQTIGAKLILFFLIGMFVLWGIGDVFRSNSPTSQVARVDGKNISLASYRRSLRSHQEQLRAMLGGRYDPLLAQKLGLETQVLYNLVNHEVIAKEAQRLGFEASDEAVRDRIAGFPAFQDENGHFSKALYEEGLKRQGMDEGQLVDKVRAEIAERWLTGLMGTAAGTDERLVMALYRARFETRRMETLVLHASDFTLPPLADREVESWYQAHAEAFSTPEYRAIRYVTLRQGEDTHDALLNRFEDAIGAGKSFDKAAEAIGQTPLALPPLARDGVTENGAKPALPDINDFLPTAFALAENEVSQPLQAADGSVILLQVASIRKPQPLPLAQARSRVMDQMMRERRSARLKEAADKLAASLQAGKPSGESTPGPAFQDAGILKKDDTVFPQGALKGQALPQGLPDAFFGLAAGRTSAAYPLANGDRIIARAGSVIPAPTLDPRSTLANSLLQPIRQEVKQALDEALLHVYFMSLRASHDVSVNLSAIQSLRQDHDEP